MRQTSIDPWFLAQIEDLIDIEKELDGRRWTDLDRGCVVRASSARVFPIAVWRSCWRSIETRSARAAAMQLGVRPVYKRVDTCAAEFATNTAYMYSTYEEECEALAHRQARRSWCWAAGRTVSARASSSIIAACMPRWRMREDGYETIMVNCNPETVSTDYDTSDRLYFEPLTLEDVLEIVRDGKARRRDRAVRRPDAAETGARSGSERRAHHRHHAGHDRCGRRPRALPADAAQAGSEAAAQPHRARDPNRRWRWPTKSAIRWWCGRPMCWAVAPWKSCTRKPICERYMREAVKVSNDSPVLLDRFLDDAIEVDVDAVIRRRGCADRRHHGAYRTGRRAFRRFGLFAAAVQPVAPQCRMNCATRPWRWRRR